MLDLSGKLSGDAVLLLNVNEALTDCILPATGAGGTHSCGTSSARGRCSFVLNLREKLFGDYALLLKVNQALTGHTLLATGAWGTHFFGTFSARGRCCSCWT